MKVILIDEVRGLGTRGDVVNVKNGYARNYLLPKNLAREATSGNLKSVEQERKKWALLASKEKEQAEKAASAVKGTKIVVHKRVGESGQLFGSVTTNEIADALTGKGFDVDKRRIELGHPIKTLGVHDVEDSGFALIRFEGGKSLEVAASWAMNQPPGQEGTTCRIYGTAGAVDVYTPTGAVIYRGFGAKNPAKPTTLKGPLVGGHAVQILL